MTLIALLYLLCCLLLFQGSLQFYRTNTAPVPSSSAVNHAGVRIPSLHDVAQNQRGLLPKKIFVDVLESESEYTISADLPGCDRNNLIVLVKNNVLHLRATRHRAAGDKRISHRSERFFGVISRALLLPNNCDQTTVVAEYDDGVLTVTMQKLPAGPPDTNTTNGTNGTGTGTDDGDGDADAQSRELDDVIREELDDEAEAEEELDSPTSGLELSR